MDRRPSFSALDIISKVIREHVRPGDICIDATAGRGNDTAMLCELVGEEGHVLAFDIQEDAISSTRKLLEERNLLSRAELHLESHSEMGKYLEEETVSCITFNFGWLPKGDHNIFTKKETSIPAIEAGLKLLSDGGIMTLILYYGRETGFEDGTLGTMGSPVGSGMMGGATCGTGEVTCATGVVGTAGVFQGAQTSRASRGRTTAADRAARRRAVPRRTRRPTTSQLAGEGAAPPESAFSRTASVQSLLDPCFIILPLS